MKRIFTLAMLLSAFCPFAHSQSQSFETAGIVTNLQSACWNFYGISESTTSPISGNRHLRVVPATSTTTNAHSNSNVGQLATPFLNFANTATISFRFRLTSPLGNNALRYISLRLSDGSTSQTITTITLNSNSSTAVLSSGNIVIPAGNGIKRLIIDFTGDGDGNTGMFFDDLVIVGAAYAYNSATCGPASSVANSTLPVRLLHFSAALQTNRVLLNWTAADNEAADYFEVQKSADGRLFTPVALVFATEKAGTEQYRFKTAPDETVAYYRLLAVNKNRTAFYSAAAEVRKSSTLAGALQLLQNPVQNQLIFQLEAKQAGMYTATVYSTNGQKLHSATLGCVAGANRFSIPVQQLQRGSYVIEVTNGKERQTATFLKP